MPSIYKQQSDEVQSLLMESWCEATQVLAQMVRKNRFIAQFLYEHRIVHRAITVPLVSSYAQSLLELRMTVKASIMCYCQLNKGFKYGVGKFEAYVSKTKSRH